MSSSTLSEIIQVNLQAAFQSQQLTLSELMTLLWLFQNATTEQEIFTILHLYKHEFSCLASVLEDQASHNLAEEQNQIQVLLSQLARDNSTEFKAVTKFLKNNPQSNIKSLTEQFPDLVNNYLDL